MAQQILKEVDESFKSFFALLKLAKKGQYNSKIKLPNYLDKDDFTTLIIGFVRLKDDMLIVPYSNSFKKTHQEVKVKLPPVLKDKKIKEIRIIPKQHSRYFEIQYIYEVEEVQRELNELKQEMMAKNIICSDLSASNILKVRRGGDSKLVVIDGFGATELFPVCKYLKLFGKKKLERQWEKLERRIGLCLKC